MNIESPNISQTNSTKNNSQNQNVKSSSVKFSDELKELEKNTKDKPVEEKNEVEKETKEEDVVNSEIKEETVVKTEETTEENTESTTGLDNEDESVNKALDGINSIVNELNTKVDQPEDKRFDPLKKDSDKTDNINNNNKDTNTLINNEFNIQDNKDLLPQMNPNMNFSGDGQPFSSFMNNTPQNPNNTLAASEKDLAEEAAILSTMAENIALANRNKMVQTTDTKQNENTTKTVTDEQGIRKVDKQTNITVENVVKFDSVIMNQADVEVFANLVEKGEADMTKLAPEAAQKAVKVSKTLADMLAKSMENNQPVRIDFDNNISVIIRVSRNGKISADFLPSSQVAEAYLKENLPLLRQRFDDNNIEYDELNQRNSREQERQNKKKERDNE